MDPMKLKLLEELLEHISGSQGNDLKSLLDESKKPPTLEGSPEEEASESPKDEELEDGKPKGLSVSKLEVLGDDDQNKNPLTQKDDEPSEDELKELIAKYLS